MTSREADPGTVSCSACGAALQPDVDEQFFCEHCGARLPDRRADAGGSPGEYQRPPRRVELRPASPPSPSRGTPRRRSAVWQGYLLAVLLVLGLVCLLGGVLVLLLTGGGG
jgi:predicted nucleic acid-binding Zn ribbon protein